MGARLLRAWLLRPCVKRGEVEARLAAVQDLLASQVRRDKLRALLKEVSDLERVVGRISLGSATPRDLCAMLRSLNQVPAIREVLRGLNASLIEVLVENTDELPDIRDLIARAINDDPPIKLSDGDTIREGYSAELDELRSTSRNAKQIIAALEATERARSGINNLRIRFNGVFGYFIEVSKANAARVPAEYERRQTLANAERFTTPELRDWEKKVLGAEERIVQLETELFTDVCRQIAAETKRIQMTARALAALDVLASSAETAARRRYTRPVLHDGDELEIIQGRHPVIEAFIDEPFVPNNVYLNNSTDRLLIITGPNMGGKSTVLRQTAIICILAQTGCFVPAERARLPLLDRIWTRVGASDDLTRGRSTFMVEMTETAAILHSATPRSLVLLDEIGRGTATFDGLSIAWAVAEYLHNSADHAAKTLFATHYHELTELAERLPGAQNYQITATEREGEVVFLHRLERGRASKSYGIEVARLAGLPPAVLANAREVLARLERYELDVFAADNELGKAARRRAAAQATLLLTTTDNTDLQIRNLNRIFYPHYPRFTDFTRTNRPCPSLVLQHSQDLIVREWPCAASSEDRYLIAALVYCTIPIHGFEIRERVAFRLERRDQHRPRTRAEPGIFCHCLGRRQLQHSHTVLPIRHIRKQARVRHGNFYLMHIVELAVRIERLIEARMFRLFHIDDRDPFRAIRDVCICSRNINICAWDSGTKAPSTTCLLGCRYVNDLQTLIINHKRIPELDCYRARIFEVDSVY